MRHAWLILGFLFIFAGHIKPQRTRYINPVFSNVKVTKNIQYGQAVNRYTNKLEKLYLDMYEPVGDTETKRPAIVMVHGGGFVSGDKTHSKYIQFGNDFAKRGFVAVSINYRLAPNIWKRKLPESAEDAQEDTKAAVRFLRRYASKYRIDPDKIAAIGSSAGGFAVVMASYYAKEGKSGNSGYSSKIQAVVDLWGGTFDLNEINPGETPIVIVHGTRDLVVPYNKYAVPLKNKCLSVGIPVDFHPIQGAGHAPWYKYQSILAWSLEWFYKYLKLTQKSGLKPKSGYSSPGMLTLYAVGPTAFTGILMVSAKRANINFGEMGVLGLDLSAGLIITNFSIKGQTKIGKASINLYVPPGLRGYKFFWQAFLYNPNWLYSFTNTTYTRF